jgi:hypothetical protein
MASRRFFVYDPYEYEYTTAPHYLYEPYYQPQSVPTRSRRARGIFAGAGAESAAAEARRAPRERETHTSFSIPVHGSDSDSEPERERKAAGSRARPLAPPAMSAEKAAARMQAAARGLLARKSVRAVRQVEREAEQVRAKIACEEESPLAEPSARVAVWEALMRMLLRLDTVRGARDYRRRVTKRVLALQDAVDALETKPAPATVSVAEETPEAAAVEVAEESAVVAPKLPDAVQEKEAVDEPEGSEAEGELEMLAEEHEHTSPVATTSDDQEPPRKEPACPLETTTAAAAGAASDGVDARKLMQMVAALCEQSAQQCALIGTLVERVDALERNVRVRLMEDAGSAGGGPRS